MTSVGVTFLGQAESSEYNWTALVDTGSPFTILPGRCQGETASVNECVSVQLRAVSVPLSEEERSIRLPVRAPNARFGGLGDTRRTHLGFTAELTMPGFPATWTSVYFDDFAETLDHAIIGTPVLFGHNGICFHRKLYCPRWCWWRSILSRLRVSR